MARRSVAAPSRTTWRRRVVRLAIRLVKAALLALVMAAAWSAGFIGVKCYSGGADAAAAAPAAADGSGMAGHTRDEASTYLTLPEWYIVYNTDEYGRALASRPPSSFPYAGSVRQYWRYYGAACDATKGVYPFSAGNHLMLAVIGSSFSIEYLLKGIYENSVGRTTEWLAGHDTPEDAFALATAVEYGAFMHTVPWYAFPFAAKIRALWTGTPASGPHLLRKWERRIALTTEYGVKAAYGWLIGLGSHATYGPEALRVHARIENAAPAIYADGTVEKVQDAAGGTVISLPRYEAFTASVMALLGQGVRFVDIAGNDQILITILGPVAFSARELQAGVVLEDPLLTDPTQKRVGLRVPVRALHIVVPQVIARGGRVEHLYDY